MQSVFAAIHRMLLRPGTLLLALLALGGCARSIPWSPLFTHDSSRHRLHKNRADYKALLKEADLFMQRDTAGVNYDSLYGASMSQWIAATLMADTNTPASIQTSWPSKERLPSISVGAAAWIIGLYSRGSAVIGTPKATYPLFAAVAGLNPIIILEYSHYYFWAASLRITPAAATIVRSDGKVLRILPNGKEGAGLDSLQQCILIVKNDTLVCPLINNIRRSSAGRSAPLFSYAYYLRQYGTAIGNGKLSAALPALAADTTPCDRPVLPRR
ncbi:MAG: hypothetical protein PHC61_04005 [Chitinivibrionales bacterium]|nr:hypothetical protein [Chitinivibrionales bacterium]